MTPTDRTRTVPQATPDVSRLDALETKVDEIHAAVVGTAHAAGLGERVRQLESFARVIKGAAVACGTAVAIAWSQLAAGPKPPHP